MNITKKEKGRITEPDVREVEQFALTAEGILKCSWCGRPYKYNAIPIESLGGFACLPGCDKITRRIAPATRKSERIWDGKQHKWQLVDKIAEILGSEAPIKVTEKTIGPIEALVLPQRVAALKMELSQPDLI